MYKKCRRIVIVIAVVFAVLVVLFILAALLGAGHDAHAATMSAAKVRKNGAGTVVASKPQAVRVIPPPRAALAASRGKPEKCFTVPIENSYVSNLLHKKEFWVKFTKQWCTGGGHVVWAPDPIYEWHVGGWASFFGWSAVNHASGTITNRYHFTESRLSVDFVQDFVLGIGPISVSKVLNSAALTIEVQADTVGNYTLRYE